jgi:hypothetical protein
MNVMTIEQRKRLQEQYQKAVAPWNGKAWRPELSAEEKRQLEKDIESGRVPF